MLKGSSWYWDQIRRSLILIVIGIGLILLLMVKEKASSEFVRIKIGDAEILAEVARTVEEQRKGLAGREHLPEKEGLLFLYPSKLIPTFWMKGMRFPIDIIWIVDKRIVDINENVPVLSVSEDKLPLYSPSEPVNMVLEVNAGFIHTHKVEKGMDVIIKGNL